MKLPKFYIGQTVLVGEYQLIITDAYYDEHEKWVYYHDEVPYEEHQIDAWVESGVWKKKQGDPRIRTI